MDSLMRSGPSKSIAKTPQGGNVLVLIGPGGRLTGIRSRFCSTSQHLSPLIVRYHTLLRNFCLVPKMPFWPSLAWDNTLALRLYGNNDSCPPGYHFQSSTTHHCSLEGIVCRLTASRFSVMYSYCTMLFIKSLGFFYSSSSHIKRGCIHCHKSNMFFGLLWLKRVLLFPAVFERRSTMVFGPGSPWPWVLGQHSQHPPFDEGAGFRNVNHRGLWSSKRWNDTT